VDLSTLYTQLILRDLISYVGPGSLVCLALAARVLGGLKEAASQVTELPGLAWIPVIAAFYIVGLAIQGLAFDVFRPNPFFRYYVVRDDSAFDQQLIDYQRALSARSEAERPGLAQQRERFVALKTATANGAVALLIAGGLLLSVYWNTTWLRRGMLLLPLVIVAVSLWFSHYRLRHSQHDFELRVIAERQSHGTARSSPPPSSGTD
jgi:hypothetical protein